MTNENTGKPIIIAQELLRRADTGDEMIITMEIVEEMGIGKKIQINY